VDERLYPCGSSAAHFVAGDFNGDGLADLAVASDSAGTLALLFNQGAGTFPTKWCPLADGGGQDGGAGDAGPCSTYSLQVGSGNSALAAGDLNGDGLADLVVVGWDKQARVLLNSDGGAFVPAATFPVGGYGLAAQLVDLNDDGALDLVIAASDTTLAGNQPGVAAFLNDGKGSFTALPMQPPGGQQIVVGDLNGDGRPDVVVGTPTSTLGFTISSLAVFLNTGQGALAAPTTYVLEETNGFGTLALADMNGDGAVDVVATDFGRGRLFVLLNDGKGNLTDPSVAPFYAVPTTASTVVAQDFNGDGRPDILLLDPGTAGPIMGVWADPGASTLNWMWSRCW
jgi:FG-GAP-like repeat